MPTLTSLSTTLCRQTTLNGLAALVTSDLLTLIPADELLVDVTSFELNRPALVRHGVDAVWAKRYNDEFHRLNPATTALRRLVQGGGPVVRRFADLCPEPLLESRFYQEYMRPQGHRFSLVGAMPLGASAVIILLVRRKALPGSATDTRGSYSDHSDVQAVPHSDFTAAELDTLALLLPSLAWGVHATMRSSEEWTAAVVKHAFNLTDKLADVAVLITRGLANKEIAAQLGLTLGTTKQYVHEVLERTGASSRSDLCRLILG